MPRRLHTIVLTLFAGFLALAFLFPFVWMLLTSLKDLPEASRFPPTLWPENVHWRNYAEATSRIPFWNYTINTLLIALMTVAGTLLSCALTAYSFARIAWRGRDAVFAITVATMMIPFPVMMIPQYAIFRHLGWVGTSAPLWVPAFFGSAYNIFLLRQFMKGIPGDLFEAAEIDGCREFQKFCLIALPLIKPALTVVAIFTFLFVWNDFMGPLIYLTERDQFTIALGLQSFQSTEGGTEVNLLMAAAALAILPVIVLFFCAQETFVEGISISGLKA